MTTFFFAAFECSDGTTSCVAFDPLAHEISDQAHVADGLLFVLHVQLCEEAIVEKTFGFATRDGLTNEAVFKPFAL